MSDLTERVKYLERKLKEKEEIKVPYKNEIAISDEEIIFKLIKNNNYNLYNDFNIEFYQLNNHNNYVYCSMKFYNVNDKIIINIKWILLSILMDLIIKLFKQKIMKYVIKIV